MKTTSVQQVPQQWADILRWIADGEEVEMTQQDRVVARLVPAAAPPPDFLARATAVWGQTPPGKTLSAIVSEDRGSAS
jgi:antitoxin (DNA-binding transcriptional repressor) of toxin-antitoxin stability system